MGEVRPLRLLRGLFLVAVLAFAWLGLRGRFDEVGEALRQTTPAAVAGALLLVLVGLTATAVLWRLLMARLGGPLPFVDGTATFFLGQLGKYIPGSVWSIGVQADLARRHAVPARVTVAGGLLFLGYHVDTAVLVGAVSLLSGALHSPWPSWISVLALVAGIVGVLPGVACLGGRRISGRDLRIDAQDVLAVIALMTVAWAAYAVALVLLTPTRPWHDLAALGGAFALAYAVGVVVVFAPAGVGARETVFVLLLTPHLGVGPATALALLGRVVHTVADGLAAAGWWLAARRRAAREVRQRRTAPVS